MIFESREMTIYLSRRRVRDCEHQDCKSEEASLSEFYRSAIIVDWLRRKLHFYLKDLTDKQPNIFSYFLYISRMWIDLRPGIDT